MNIIFIKFNAVIMELQKTIMNSIHVLSEINFKINKGN